MRVHGDCRVRSAVVSTAIATATRPNVTRVVRRAARKVRAVTDRAASWVHGRACAATAAIAGDTGPPAQAGAGRSG